MANRRQRSKRTAFKKARLTLAHEEAIERGAREAIILTNMREIRSMTPEQKDEARIQQKVDAAFRSGISPQPNRGNGSGGYLGAHTVIGPHTPGWFGRGSD